MIGKPTNVTPPATNPAYRQGRCECRGREAKVVALTGAIHPWKLMSVEPKNRPIEEEKSFSKPPWLCSRLILPGCMFLWGLDWWQDVSMLWLRLSFFWGDRKTQKTMLLHTPNKQVTGTPKQFSNICNKLHMFFLLSSGSLFVQFQKCKWSGGYWSHHLVYLDNQLLQVSFIIGSFWKLCTTNNEFDFLAAMTFIFRS